MWERGVFGYKDYRGRLNVLLVFIFLYVCYYVLREGEEEKKRKRGVERERARAWIWEDFSKQLEVIILDS